MEGAAAPVECWVLPAPSSPSSPPSSSETESGRADARGESADGSLFLLPVSLPLLPRVRPRDDEEEDEEEEEEDGGGDARPEGEEDENLRVLPAEGLAAGPPPGMLDRSEPYT
jgi:hypothetical protein